MNVGRHHVADDLVYEAVSAHGVHAGKALRHHENRKVPASVGSARMTGMAVTVVDHLEMVGFERLQALREPFCSCLRHGSTLMNGLTSQDSNTPSVT